jgi:16S rRNA (uracil1498-N3)-methyltransferase
MPGHRFFTSFQKTDQSVVLKDADEFQHLTKVLRLKKGDEIELINGQGGLAKGCVGDIGKTSAVISLQEVSFMPRPAGVRITLACAIPKRSKFETIIEKCTELGVDRIVPLLTERTEFIADGERADKKLERFSRVAMNAAKQCKRLWFPKIVAPVAFSQAVKDMALSEAALFIPWLEGERMPLSQAFAQKTKAKEFVFFIGPEGDFTPDEVRLALKAGAVPVSLGENVLKVDTASMAVVAYARMHVSTFM